MEVKHLITFTLKSSVVLIKNITCDNICMNNMKMIDKNILSIVVTNNDSE